MKVFIRTVPERVDFVNYMKSKIPNAESLIDYEHIGKDYGNTLFARHLGNLEEDSILIEDDQFICDNFLDIAKEQIKKYPNRIIAFSWLEHYDSTKQFREEKAVKRLGTNGFFTDLESVCTFCLYIPKEIGKRFHDWYFHILYTNNEDKLVSEKEFKKFTEKSQWYDQILGIFISRNNIAVYVNAFPSLTGHNVDLKSAMKHKNNRLCRSINFDYERYEKEYEAFNIRLQNK